MGHSVKSRAISRAGIDDAKHATLQDLLVANVLIEFLGLSETDSFTFGLLLRLHRAKHGKTVSEMSKLTGIDRGHLGALERDEHRPNQMTLRELEKVFGPGFIRGATTLLESEE